VPVATFVLVFGSWLVLLGLTILARVRPPLPEDDE
jgi:hypothetical protein